MKTHNELSQVTITARAVNKDGLVFTPTNARYRVDDLDSETAIVAWTSLTPSAEMTITINATDNAMQNANKAIETRVVTVETDAGLATAHPDEYRYKLKNLTFIT